MPSSVTSKKRTSRKRGQRTLVLKIGLQPKQSRFTRKERRLTTSPIQLIRITVIRVDPLDPLELIPKSRLEEALEREASDFLGAVLTLELPEPVSRLSIPVLTTLEKVSIEIENQNQLLKFMQEKMQFAPGVLIPFIDFMIQFHKWLPPEEINNWGKITVSKKVPMQFPGSSHKICKGSHHNNKTFLANVSWVLDGIPDLGKPPYVMNDKGYLMEVPS